MEQHKTTPWKIGAMESGMVAIDSGDDQEVTGFIDPEDACRILACVNACAGFSLTDLEEVAKHGGFIDQTRYNSKITKQRDGLLAALEYIGRYIDPTANDAEAMVKQARAAIASVKGGSTPVIGWIEWKGGLCPVAEDSMVMVTYRDGEVGGPFPANQNVSWFDRDAGPEFWRNDRQANDIIAYRVVKGGAA